MSYIAIFFTVQPHQISIKDNHTKDVMTKDNFYDFNYVDHLLV